MGSYGIYDCTILFHTIKHNLQLAEDLMYPTNPTSSRSGTCILHNYVRTNLRNKTILSCDCLSVHELKKQRSVCPWDEKPQALSACIKLIFFSADLNN